MVQFKFSMNNWSGIIRRHFGSYAFEAGIFEDTPYKAPQPKSKGFKKLYGGLALKTSSKTTNKTVVEIGKELNLIFNWLGDPWEYVKSDEIKLLMDKYIIFLNSSYRGAYTTRIANLIQAVVRNPILRGDYGINRAAREEEKGFNRLMIATGQFFNSIKGRIVRRH